MGTMIKLHCSLVSELYSQGTLKLTL